MSSVIRSIMLGLLLLAGAGCPVLPPDNVPPLPRTVFSSPTTVPSVTPTVTSAVASNAVAQERSVEAQNRAVRLTPDNLVAEKSPLIDLLASLTSAIIDTGAKLANAAAESRASDQAWARAAKERDDARALVTLREDERDAIVKKDRAALTEKDGEIAKLKSDADAKDRAMARWIFGVAVGLGGLVAIAGAIIIFLVSPRIVGVIVCGAGMLASALGTAGLFYGKEIAIAGMAVGATAIIGAIWAAIHYLRNDAISIADGVQQAMNAGKIKLEDVKTFFDQAQTPGAARLVDAATK